MLTGADVFIVAVVLASTVFGVIRGFVREAVSLVCWVGGIWAAWVFGPMIEPHLGGLLAAPAVRPWIGRAVVLVGVLLLGALIGLILGRFTRGLGLGMLDRGIGILFGFARGMVLVGVIVICGELLHLDHEHWWGRSKLIPYGEGVGDWLRAMVGEHGEPWSRLERLTGVKVR
jgi:membrane protein required for colicin V production